jgi:acetyl esterase/lipase
MPVLRLGPKVFYAVATLFLLSAVSRAADPPEVTKSYDLLYASHGGTELKLDLVQPAGAGPFPAVLVIHGGAWREGGKEENHKLLTDFARRGYVAASPQYRFAPKDRFPAQILDVKAAVRWLRANAKDLRVDAEHFGAMGFSAGAHLALMLGLTGPEDGFEGDAAGSAPSSRVQAVVSFFAPTDLADPKLSEFGRSLVRDFLGGTAAEKPAAARKSSPVTYVSRGDAPVLIFQGTKDPLVPYTQAVKLTEALTAAGVPGRVELLVGSGHGWQGEEFERTMEETFEFFDRNLKLAPAR